jgi:hypothetical protein
MTPPVRAGRRIAAISGIAMTLVLAFPAVARADGITLTRSCQDSQDAACGVQVAPLPTTSVVAGAGPSTALGPAIELNLAVTQLADAGTAVGRSGVAAGPVGPLQSAGTATNGFDVSVVQTGTSSATSGSAGAGSSGAQAGGSSAAQNPPSSGSDPGASGGQSPPAGGSGSGINMITNVASVVQIVQVVAHNNSNTTIAPIQVAAQCQQAAVSCSGNPSSHP